jgi:hypothetical protein
VAFPPLLFILSGPAPLHGGVALQRAFALQAQADLLTRYHPLNFADARLDPPALLDSRRGLHWIESKARETFNIPVKLSVA